MMASTFMSAPHFRWSFADVHCSRMHPGWPCDVLGQAFLRGLVEDANAVVDTKAGVPPGQEVSGKILV